MARPEPDRPAAEAAPGARSKGIEFRLPWAVAEPERLSIGIDIGGSSIRGALVDSVGAVSTVIVDPTPDDEKELDDVLTEVVERLVGGSAGRFDRATAPVGVGLAVAGFLDRDRRLVRFAPHLPWINRPVAEILAQRWGLPVLLEHDANSAGWAEYRHGAAAGAQVAAVVTIGTGIGAALLVDGELFRGAHGVAPELGHLQVVPNGRRCPCGKRGCLERYCSGTALVDTATELARQGRYDGPLADAVRAGAAGRGGLEGSALEGSALEGAEAVGREVVGRDVVAAADAGEPLGVDTMHRFGDWLAVGLAFAIDLFDPDCIVLCGGMARRSIRELGDVHTRLRPLVTGGRHRPLPDVRLGMLGETAGLIGAADLAAAHFGRGVENSGH